MPAGLDRLRDSIGDADRVEVAGMHGVPRAGDDGDVGAQLACHADDLVDRRLIVDSDDQGGACIRPQLFRNAGLAASP